MFTMGTRHHDREQRRAAANRRIGHDMAYWYQAQFMAVWVGPPVVIAAAVAWVWFNVDHTHIARALFLTGLAFGAMWAVKNVVATSASARIRQRARGVPVRNWHPLGLAGAVLIAAACLVWVTS